MSTVSDLRFAYNVEKLEQVYQELRQAKSAYKYCVRNSELHPDRHIDVYPKQCSRYCTCICCCYYDRRDGISFYEEETERLTAEFESEKEKALDSPLGIAFITFETHQMAKDVYDVFHDYISVCFKPKLPKTKLTKDIQPEEWRVTYAPQPDDIYWTRLNSPRRYFVIKYILVNIALFLFLLFLSTPGKLKYSALK